MSLPMHQASLIEACEMCNDELLHCHGTAIVLVSGSHVCSDDPDCVLAINEHWFMSIDDRGTLS